MTEEKVDLDALAEAMARAHEMAIDPGTADNKFAELAALAIQAIPFAVAELRAARERIAVLEVAHAAAMERGEVVAVERDRLCTRTVELEALCRVADADEEELGAAYDEVARERDEARARVAELEEKARITSSGYTSTLESLARREDECDQLHAELEAARAQYRALWEKLAKARGTLSDQEATAEEREQTLVETADRSGGELSATHDAQVRKGGG